jgi:hypothetical protein
MRTQVRCAPYADTEVRPHATGEIGIGERWMNYRLEREHLLQMDCKALEAFGREHVAAARSALEDAAKVLDPGKSWQQRCGAT